MKTNEKLIEKLTSYLYDFYRYGSWSEQEQLNFLNLYARFIFDYNNIKFDPNIYQFHFGGKDLTEGAQAVVYKDIKNGKDFYNIYLSTIKSISNKEPIKDKVKKQRIRLSGVDELTKINFTISQIYLAGHELHHVIQWLKNELYSKKFDNFSNKLELSIPSKSWNEYNNRKDSKEIDKFKNKHLDYSDSLATAEKEAESKTVEYFKHLVTVIIKNETDQDFKNFLIEAVEKMLFELKCRCAENALIEKLDNQIVKRFIKKYNLDKKSIRNIRIP